MGSEGWELVSVVSRCPPDGARLSEVVDADNTAGDVWADTAYRSAVEHVFARQKGPMALVVRTMGIARARVKIGLANLAYNIKRLVWLSGRPAPA
jgi:hypothetical protein